MGDFRAGNRGFRSRVVVGENVSVRRFAWPLEDLVAVSTLLRKVAGPKWIREAGALEKALAKTFTHVSFIATRSDVWGDL